MIRDTEACLKWIVGVLNSNNIQFNITGGFAAKIYGSIRELNDIDIEVENSNITKVANLVKPYITFGPQRYKDTTWDLDVLTLVYEGQEVDVSSGDNGYIFNKNTLTWDPLATDLKDKLDIEVFGQMVPVSTPQALIEYKSKIAFDEWKHEADIKALISWISRH